MNRDVRCLLMLEDYSFQCKLPHKSDDKEATRVVPTKESARRALVTLSKYHRLYR